MGRAGESLSDVPTKGITYIQKCTIYAKRGAQNFFWHGGWIPQVPTKGITNIQICTIYAMRGAQNFFWHGGWDPQFPTKWRDY